MCGTCMTTYTISAEAEATNALFAGILSTEETGAATEETGAATEENDGGDAAGDGGATVTLGSALSGDAFAEANGAAAAASDEPIVVIEGDTDFGDAINTAQFIEIGSGVFGTFDDIEDVDLFEMELEAGLVYSFKITPTSPGAASGFNLYDGEGEFLLLGGTVPPNPGQRISFVPDEDMTVYMQTFGLDDYLFVSRADPLDPLLSLDLQEPLPTTDIVVYLPSVGHQISESGDYGNQTYDTRALSDDERDAAIRMIETYDSVSGLNITYTDDIAEANMAIFTRTSNGTSYAYPLGGEIAVDGVAQPQMLVWNSLGWKTPRTAEDLANGTSDFELMNHEFGHSMGLAHPHDFGGESLAMAGVSSTGDLGYYELNQSVYTVMSYNTGWDDQRGGAGHAAGPMALDIAMLQQLYGTKEANEGDDVYVLSDVRAGEGYLTIWDTGGVDTISAAAGTDRNAVIDLRAATIEYDELGGGAVSHHANSAGGFTIAAGVVIENATGADGDDSIRGNDAANEIRGGGGRDDLFGQQGDDALHGDGGEDEIDGGGGGDSLHGGDDADRLLGKSGEDMLFGDDGADFLNGGNGSDELFGGSGDDTLRGSAGGDLLSGGEGSDRLFGGAGDDRFEFDADWGKDTIRDFEDGRDLILFSAESGIASLDDVRIGENGAGHAVIRDLNDPDNRIVIRDAGGLVDADDIVFEFAPLVDEFGIA